MKDPGRALNYGLVLWPGNNYKEIWNFTFLVSFYLQDKKILPTVLTNQPKQHLHFYWDFDG